MGSSGAASRKSIRRQDTTSTPGRQAYWRLITMSGAGILSSTGSPLISTRCGSACVGPGAAVSELMNSESVRPRHRDPTVSRI